MKLDDLNLVTLRYNSTDHPIAFHKAQEFKIQKLAGGPAPDLEDVFDVITPTSAAKR